MKTKVAVVVGLVCLAIAGVALLPALSQPGDPGPGGPGMGPPGMPGGPMMRGPMGPPPGPPVQMVAADGVLYVATEGKVIALEAKTLKKLAETTVAERPAPPGLPPGNNQ